MPFLLSHKDGEHYEWSGDGPSGPYDQIPHRKMNRQEARDYLIAVGCPLEEVESVLDRGRTDLLEIPTKKKEV